MMAMTEAEAWAAYWRGLNGAKAWIEIRGWGDPRPRFNVVFRDGAKFTGGERDVQDRALVYARTVYKLTGEWP